MDKCDENEFSLYSDESWGVGRAICVKNAALLKAETEEAFESYRM